MIDREIKVIGFIGLGVMGCSMSKNLLKNKNWNVLVKDLNANKEKELENQGAKIASDTREIFTLSDLVITCLPGGDFVRDLYYGKDKYISDIKINQFHY